MSRVMIEMNELIDEISMGPFGSDIKVDNFVEMGVPVLNGSNVNGVRLTEESFNYVTPEKAKSLKKANVKRGDIVITHRGTLGQIAFIPENSLYDNYVISQSQFKVTLKPKLVDPAYFTYYFHTNEGQKRLLSFKNHVGVPALAQATSNFRKLEFPLIPLFEQKKIAKVLSDLDAKIELNNKINIELEAMAKTLYEYWFVQFDFPFDFAQGKPNENGKPYKSSGGKMVWNEELKREIPEGWEVKEMSDLCVNVQSGGTPNTSKQEYYKGNINWFSTQELNDTFNLDSLKNINELAVKESSTKLFPENTVLIAIYASPTVGRLGILSKQGTFNQACCGLVAKANIGKEYIFLTLLKNRKLLNVLATGTTQKNLGVSTIKSLNVIIPEDKTLDLFIKQVRPLFNKILNNLKENQELASLRDWLLPMLMNGQVTVASTGSATEKGCEVEDSELGMVAEDKVEYKKG